MQIRDEGIWLDASQWSRLEFALSGGYSEIDGGSASYLSTV
jgi:hypothetical protein